MQYREKGTINVFSSHTLTKERIVENIRRLIRDIGSELSNFKLTIKNAIIAKKWGQPRSIFKTDE